MSGVFFNYSVANNKINCWQFLRLKKVCARITGIFKQFACQLTFNNHRLRRAKTRVKEQLFTGANY